MEATGLRPCGWHTILKAGWTDEKMLSAVRRFALELARAPTSEEFVTWRAGGDVPHMQAYIQRFGSWPRVVSLAGLPTNRVSLDGDRCDSSQERDIDDWFYRNGIPHRRHVPYPRDRNDRRSLTCDFVIGDLWIEYTGFANGQGVENDNYRARLDRKRAIVLQHDLTLLELSGPVSTAISRLQAATI